MLKEKAGDPTIGLLGKARGLLVRLSLILHLTSWASGEPAKPSLVNETSLNRATLLLEDYLIPMWTRIFQAFGRHLDDDAAERIGKYIIEKRLADIRVNDIIKLGRKGMQQRPEVEAAFAKLVDHDWLAPPTTALARGRGRPSLAYEVNPRVFSLLSASHE